MSLQVDCTNLSSNPRCPHGPMVKFTKTIRGGLSQFFGCTACRDSKSCPFSLKCDAGGFSANQLRAINDHLSRITPQSDRSVITKFEKLAVKKRVFCQSCFVFVFPDAVQTHSDHDVIMNVTDDMLSRPSQFVTAKTNDKVEAQYWFSNETKSFISSFVQQLGVTSVLCVGSPTVYEVVKITVMKSMLLDLDSRYTTFYNDQEFAWFNMMNFHFMSDESAGLVGVKRILNVDKALVIIDPPFGARLELLSYTVNRLSGLCRGELLVFIALPYFMEPQVIKHFPGFQMLDYVLFYENHSKMKTHKKSAVRFFTNVSPSSIKLPISEGYKFCSKCDCWRHPNNKHCDSCGTCPSKNASTYIHCRSCDVCVKSTWEHCNDCQRCFLKPHKCHENPSLKRKLNDNVKRKKKKLK